MCLAVVFVYRCWPLPPELNDGKDRLYRELWAGVSNPLNL